MFLALNRLFRCRAEDIGGMFKVLERQRIAGRILVLRARRARFGDFIEVPVVHVCGGRARPRLVAQCTLGIVGLVATSLQVSRNADVPIL